MSFMFCVSLYFFVVVGLEMSGVLKKDIIRSLRSPSPFSALILIYHDCTHSTYHNPTLDRPIRAINFNWLVEPLMAGIATTTVVAQYSPTGLLVPFFVS
jgi:hypothetical protein